MLDYLKKVSSIFIILFLFVSICYTKTNDSENKIIFRELSDYIINNEWDFEDENESFSKESYDLEQFFKEYKVDFSDYFIAVMKFQNVDYNIFVIKVFIILKGDKNFWIGKWVLTEGENTTEEIEKRKRDDVKSL